MSDLSDLQEAFDTAGVCRGTMNGKPLHFIADPDGGESRCFGQMALLAGLRNYEERTGRRRDWKESFKMQIRAGVAEARAKRKAALA